MFSGATSIKRFILCFINLLWCCSNTFWSFGIKGLSETLWQTKLKFGVWLSSPVSVTNPHLSLTVFPGLMFEIQCIAKICAEFHLSLKANRFHALSWKVVPILNWYLDPKHNSLWTYKEILVVKRHLLYMPYCYMRVLLCTFIDACIWLPFWCNNIHVVCCQYYWETLLKVYVQHLKLVFLFFFYWIIYPCTCETLQFL